MIKIIWKSDPVTHDRVAGKMDDNNFPFVQQCFESRVIHL